MPNEQRQHRSCRDFALQPLRRGGGQQGDQRAREVVVGEWVGLGELLGDECHIQLTRGWRVGDLHEAPDRGRAGQPGEERRPDKPLQFELLLGDRRGLARVTPQVLEEVPAPDLTHAQPAHRRPRTEHFQQVPRGIARPADPGGAPCRIRPEAADLAKQIVQTAFEVARGRIAASRRADG